MKRIGVISGIIMAALVGLSLATVPNAARAATNSDSTVTIAAGETRNGALIKAAQEVEIDGVVNGDVLVATSKFVLKGTVNGSIYVLAESARIDGTVTGNIHVAASDVELNGRAASVYSASSSYLSSKEAVVTGGLAVAASTAKVGGSVGQSAYVAAADVRYNATTGGSVKLMATDVTVGSSAVVSGDLSYSEDAQIKLENDQNIKGSIKKIAAPKQKAPVWFDKLSGAAYGLLASLVLGLALLWVAPASMIATGDYMKRYPAKAMISGAGFVFMAPLAILFTMLTLVGLPLGIIELMVYVAVLMIAHIFVAVWLGRQLLKRSKDVSVGANLLPLVVGLALTGAIELLPIFGGLASFIILLAGAGALVARTWERIAHVSKAQRAA